MPHAYREYYDSTHLSALDRLRRTRAYLKELPVGFRIEWRYGKDAASMPPVEDVVRISREVAKDRGLHCTNEMVAHPQGWYPWGTLTIWFH